MAKTVETFSLTIAGKPFRVDVGGAVLLSHRENGPVGIARVDTLKDAETIEKSLAPTLGGEYEWRVASDPRMAISMDDFVKRLTDNKRYFTENDRGKVIHARTGETIIPILS